MRRLWKKTWEISRVKQCGLLNAPSPNSLVAVYSSHIELVQHLKKNKQIFFI